MTTSLKPAGPAYRIETARLILRCWQPDDAPVLVDVLSDGRADHFLQFIPFLAASRDVSAWAAVLRLWRADHDLDRHSRFPMFDAANDALIGEVMLLDREGIGERELGIWLDPRRPGQGYAAEAAVAMVRVAFAVDGVPQVDVVCDRENARALRAAERLGFQRIGTRTVGEGLELELLRLIAADYVAGAGSRRSLRVFNCLRERLL